MSDARWVQHVSGRGEKWRLMEDGRVCNDEPGHPVWVVDARHAHAGTYLLPKSEYRICEPAVVWKEVTHECQVDDYMIQGVAFWSIMHRAKDGAYLNVLAKENGYMLRRITVPIGIAERAAFIIKRRQP